MSYLISEENSFFRKIILGLNPRIAWKVNRTKCEPFNGYALKKKLFLVFIRNSNGSGRSKRCVHRELSRVVNSLRLRFRFL